MTTISADLTERVALVVGGGSGIGRACAIGLASNGASVVVSGRGQERLDETVRMVNETGGVCLAVVADVTRRSQVAEMVEKAFKWKGQLDILPGEVDPFGQPGGPRGLQGHNPGDLTWTDTEKICFALCKIPGTGKGIVGKFL